VDTTLKHSEMLTYIKPHHFTLPLPYAFGQSVKKEVGKIVALHNAIFPMLLKFFPCCENGTEVVFCPSFAQSIWKHILFECLPMLDRAF